MKTRRPSFIVPLLFHGSVPNIQILDTRNFVPPRQAAERMNVSFVTGREWAKVFVSLIMVFILIIQVVEDLAVSSHLYC